MARARSRNDRPSSRRGRGWALAGLVLLLAVTAGGLRWLLRSSGADSAPAPAPAPQPDPFAGIQEIDPRARTLRRLVRISSGPDARPGMSHDDRNSLIIAELARSINDDFQEFSRLPQAEKQEMARRILDDARITQRFFHRFPMGKQHKAVALFLRSSECQKQFYRAVSIVGNDLSAEDLKMLGPAIRIWASMIKGQ